MSKIKIIGTVDERRQNSARIKVLSFKKNNESITDPEQILQAYPPFGYVFAKDIFIDSDLTMNSLIEFYKGSFTYQDTNLDRHTMDVTLPWKPFGFRVMPISNRNAIVEDVLYPNVLSGLLNDDLFQFYIKFGGYLYGPLKCSKGEISAHKFREAYKYEYEPAKVYESGDFLYLLNEPERELGQIDCMSPGQLADWIKKEIGNLSLNIDANRLKSALNTNDTVSLHNIRLRRAVKELDTLALNKESLLQLTANSDRLSELYTKSIETIKVELQREYVEGFLNQKSAIVAEIDALKRKLDAVKVDYDQRAKDLLEVKQEYDWILQERERLISDIRLHLEVHRHEGALGGRLLTYEEQTYVNEAPFYRDLNEFIDVLGNQFRQSGFDAPGLAEKICYAFKGRKCILCDSLPLILAVAKMTNNCRLIIQQTEADWLKYEDFYENGLKQIFTMAFEKPETMHFLILEDINLAGIECYGNPVLDIIAGYRHRLPGLRLEWPGNLWLFGLPVEQPEEEKMGLTLFRKTFKDWGFFPKASHRAAIDNRLDLNFRDSAKRLSVEQLLEHDHIEKSFAPEYFEDL